MAEKKKIAFIVNRYGREINGGGEVHCRMLAERLSGIYNVEVLTTCAKEYTTFKNEYPEGIEEIDGVTVHRFLTAPVRPDRHRRFQKRAKWGRKIRRNLYRIGWLKYLSSIFPVWTIKAAAEKRYQRSIGCYSPDLFEYIRCNEAEYTAFIFITYIFPLTQFGCRIVPQKSILIPTAHNESELFFSINTWIFTKVSHIAFNTDSEKRLCEDIFGKALARNSIVGVGIEFSPAAEWTGVKEKYSLPDNYALYLGRVDRGKINNLVENFITYKKSYPDDDVKLVLTGGIYAEKIDNEDIIYTGFVDDNEKTTILEHSMFMINPSLYESLSLLLLEAMSKRKAVLVNGNCDVLKDHCSKSQGAAIPYFSESDFTEQIHRLVSDRDLRDTMGEKGKVYVDENYDWEVIVTKFCNIIDNL